MDGVIVIGYEDSWMAIFVAREVESRVATRVVLLVLDVEWESYGLPIITGFGHTAGLEVRVHSTEGFFWYKGKEDYNDMVTMREERGHEVYLTHLRSLKLWRVEIYRERLL